MSIKIRYLFSHLDRFPENIGDVSKEQEEHFHQDYEGAIPRLMKHPNDVQLPLESYV